MPLKIGFELTEFGNDLTCAGDVVLIDAELRGFFADFVEIAVTRFRALVAVCRACVVDAYFFVLAAEFVAGTAAFFGITRDLADVVLAYGGFVFTAKQLIRSAANSGADRYA